MNVRANPSFRRLPLALAGLAATAAALLVSGCEEDAGPLPANLPPVTYLIVQGTDLDTVDYRRVLRWWGSDPDGEVVGYCIRWDGEWEPPAGSVRCEDDPSFVFTTATVDTFVVPTTGTFAERTFSVYAVDDEGMRDPAGRSQLFRLRNWEPELFWSNTISRPSISLPAISFACTARDLDGNETVDRFRVWLDGEDPAEDGRAFSDTLFGLGVEDFGGRWGERTLYVQAYDEALTPSNVIEHTWTVEAPPDARLLLIDNVSSRTPGESVEDDFYRAVLDEVAPNDYFVFDVELRGDFRSDAEIGPLFDLFEGVLWYGGVPDPENDASLFRNLAAAELALREYLRAGGDVLLLHRDAVGDSAGLSPAFAEDVAGVAGYYRDRATGMHDIRLRPRALVSGPLLAPGDTLEIASSTATADFLQVDPDIEPLLWVAPGFLDSTAYEPPQLAPAVLGLESRRLQGRFGLVTFHLSRSDRRGNARAAGIALARRILD